MRARVIGRRVLALVALAAWLFCTGPAWSVTVQEVQALESRYNELYAEKKIPQGGSRRRAARRQREEAIGSQTSDLRGRAANARARVQQCRHRLSKRRGPPGSGKKFQARAGTPGAGLSGQPSGNSAELRQSRDNRFPARALSGCTDNAFQSARNPAEGRRPRSGLAQRQLPQSWRRLLDAGAVWGCRAVVRQGACHS